MTEMTREGSVIRSLVEMADTLVDDFDVVDMLTHLADRCVTVLGVSAAGVMLASPAGDLRLVASSSEAMRVLELFELQTQEGPCLDAFRTGERVGHEGLRAGTSPWPRFSVVALEAGFQSVFALPLRLRERIVGALNLFRFEPTPMDEEDVLVVQAFADLATISVVQHRAATETQLINEQLAQALTSRVLIEQAKGVVFERAGIDMAEAFRVLFACQEARRDFFRAGEAGRAWDDRRGVGLVRVREWLVRRAGVSGCEPAALESETLPVCPPGPAWSWRRASAIRAA